MMMTTMMIMMPREKQTLACVLSFGFDASKEVGTVGDPLLVLRGRRIVKYKFQFVLAKEDLDQPSTVFDFHPIPLAKVTDPGSKKKLIPLLDVRHLQ